MTTICAIQGATWAVIGYDDQASEESGRKYRLSSDSSKCFVVGDYIIGVAGEYRAVSTLKHTLTPPPSPKIYGIELDHFIITKFIPAIKKCYTNAAHGSADVAVDALLMVCVNATVYVIDPDWTFLRDESGISAIGSGGSYALGALHGLVGEDKRSLVTARSQVEIAMNVSGLLDSNTSVRHTILTQKK